MDVKQYTIEELGELTGFTRRTIRFYVQEGLLEPPAGRGRGGFYYDSHLETLRHIKSLQERDLSLAEPVNYPREVWVKYAVTPGLEINVRRDLEQLESKKIFEIIKIARALLEEKSGNE
jgi:hypothetical protein